MHPRITEEPDLRLLGAASRVSLIGSQFKHRFQVQGVLGLISACVSALGQERTFASAHPNVQFALASRRPSPSTAPAFLDKARPLGKGRDHPPAARQQ